MKHSAAPDSISGLQAGNVVVNSLANANLKVSDLTVSIKAFFVFTVIGCLQRRNPKHNLMTWKRRKDAYSKMCSTKI